MVTALPVDRNQRCDADLDHGAPESAKVEISSTPLGTMVAARAIALDEAKRRMDIEIGGRAGVADLDACVDTIVAATAVQRGERLIVERGADGWVVLGALRTTPTPGVDRGQEFHIAAKRLKLEGTHDLRLVSGAASVVLQAVGQFEVFAKNITSRASGLHKIVGRMLHLN
jgi:hypothetical protein